MRPLFTWLWRSLGAILAAQAAGAARAEALQTPAASGPTLAQEGYSALDAGRPMEAARKLTAALDAGDLTAEQQRVACLSLADVMMGLGHAREAAGLLCLQRQPPSFEVLSRLAYAQDALRDRPAAAQSYAAAAGMAAAPPDRARMWAGQALALAEQGDTAAALQVARRLAGDPNLTQAQAVNLAYLALRSKDDRLALQFFVQADRLQPIGGSAVLDAGYAAKRLGDEPTAMRFFQQGLKAAVVGPGAAPTTGRDDIRREMSELSRRGGAVASVFYDSADQRGGRLPGAGSGNLQVGAEAYLRPLGLNGGRPVEVFVRGFQTLSSRRGDPTGGETLQGWAGGRVKPVASQNLVIEASRLVKLGEASRADWMVRASYSATRGMDLPVRRGPMLHAFVDAAQLFKGGETLLYADARAGRSFGSDRAKLIVAPFVGVVAAYDSSLSRSKVLSAGPGVWARRYFREDRIHAPRSYVDVSLQYRARVAGDQRMHGLFASMTVSY